MKLIDLLFATLLTILGLSTGGCASLEVYAGIRRSDQSTETRQAVDKPIRSWWYGNGTAKPLSGE